MNNLMEADINANKKPDLYREGMSGIKTKVAMQVIRRIVRDRMLDDEEKLGAIVTVIHSFESDKEGK